MSVEILTKDDLYSFRVELLNELKTLLSAQPYMNKKWLKSLEVRKMLSISPGTLQNLRINGTLPYTQIGGVMYYSHEDILKMLESNKRNSK